MSRRAINSLHYNGVEVGAGEPLVLLHCFTGSAANWRTLTQAFAGDFRTLAIDLPGHGSSDAPDDPERYSMMRIAADLNELLRELNAAPACWIGYSMGGRLALFIAATYPHLVRQLVLESASPGLATAAERATRQAQDEALAQRIESEGVAAFVNHWERLPLFDSQSRLAAEERAALRAQRLDNRATGLANSLRGMGAGAQPSLWPRLMDIDRPVLLITGELDEKFVGINRQMSAVLPSAELRIAPKAGHAVHLEQPEWFAAAVRLFISGELIQHKSAGMERIAMK